MRKWAHLTAPLHRWGSGQLRERDASCQAPSSPGGITLCVQLFFFFRFFGDGIQSESGKMITKWTDVCVFTFSRVLPPSLNSAQVELDEASSTHKGPYFFFRGYKKSRAAFTCQRCALSVQPALKTCVILVLKNEICLSLPGPCRMWNPALQCLNVWDFFKAINVKRKHPFFPLTERERGVVHYHSMSVQVEQQASHIPVPGVMTLRYADPPPPLHPPLPSPQGPPSFGDPQERPLF